MKRHISLLVAVVMVLTLIYTPAGLVYADNGEMQEGTQPVEETSDLELGSEAKDKIAEESATEEKDSVAGPEKNTDASVDSNSESTVEKDTGNEEIKSVQKNSVKNTNVTQSNGEVPVLEVTVTEQKANSIVLTWSATEGAVSYKVFNGETECSANITGSETITATISELTPNTEYTFTVIAYDSANEKLASGEVTTSTTIDAIKNLKALHKKATVKSVVLTWSATEEAASYKVFNGETESSAKITGSETITAVVSGLSARKDYTFTVKAFDQDGKELAEGTVKAYTSTNCTKKTLPTVKVTKAFPNYVVSWAKRTDVVGYEFRYSTKKNKGTIKKLGKGTLKRTVTKLKNGKTYYFQVRAKYQYKDGPIVTSGWKTVSRKVTTTGWKAVLKNGKKFGKKYYYVNGVMQKNKEFWLGKLKYYVDKNGVWRGGSKYMWGRCKKQTSGTDTMLVTSRNRHTVCIFKKIDGTWCCQYEWLCSVGKKGSKTPHGKFYVRSKKKSFGKGHTCWYATRYHKKYPKAAFHSVLYKKGSKTKIKDGRLGKNISNGCVRLSLKWAKWIYDNVKKRSRILIY